MIKNRQLLIDLLASNPQIGLTLSNDNRYRLNHGLDWLEANRFLGPTPDGRPRWRAYFSCEKPVDRDFLDNLSLILGSQVVPLRGPPITLEIT